MQTSTAVANRRCLRGCTKAHKAESDLASVLLAEAKVMKSTICISVAMLSMLASCVVQEPVPVTTTTTTEVRRETVTTGPGGVTREVVVTRSPPAVRVEAQTVSPGPNYVWTQGYWRWTGSDYVWVPGSWIVRPRVGAVYVQGHWTRTSAGWVYVPGRWQ